MHSHVWGSHRPKFDNDEFNSVRHTDRQTDRQTDTHTHSGLSTLNCSKLLTTLKAKTQLQRNIRPRHDRFIFETLLSTGVSSSSKDMVSKWVQCISISGGVCVGFGVGRISNTVYTCTQTSLTLIHKLCIRLHQIQSWSRVQSGLRCNWELSWN